MKRGKSMPTKSGFDKQLVPSEKERDEQLLPNKLTVRTHLSTCCPENLNNSFLEKI